MISDSPLQPLKILFSTSVLEELRENVLVPIRMVSPPFSPNSGRKPK